MPRNVVPPNFASHAPPSAGAALGDVRLRPGVVDVSAAANMGGRNPAWVAQRVPLAQRLCARTNSEADQTDSPRRVLLAQAEGLDASVDRAELIQPKTPLPKTPSRNGIVAPSPHLQRLMRRIAAVGALGGDSSLQRLPTHCVRSQGVGERLSARADWSASSSCIDRILTSPTLLDDSPVSGTAPLVPAQASHPPPGELLTTLPGASGTARAMASPSHEGDGSHLQALARSSRSMGGEANRESILVGKATTVGIAPSANDRPPIDVESPTPTRVTARDHAVGSATAARRAVGSTAVALSRQPTALRRESTMARRAVREPEPLGDEGSQSDSAELGSMSIGAHTTVARVAFSPNHDGDASTLILSSRLQTPAASKPEPAPNAVLGSASSDDGDSPLVGTKPQSAAFDARKGAPEAAISSPLGFAATPPVLTRATTERGAQPTLAREPSPGREHSPADGGASFAHAANGKPSRTTTRTSVPLAAASTSTGGGRIAATATSSPTALRDVASLQEPVAIDRGASTELELAHPAIAEESSGARGAQIGSTRSGGPVLAIAATLGTSGAFPGDATRAPSGLRVARGTVASALTPASDPGSASALLLSRVPVSRIESKSAVPGATPAVLTPADGHSDSAPARATPSVTSAVATAPESACELVHSGTSGRLARALELPSRTASPATELALRNRGDGPIGVNAPLSRGLQRVAIEDDGASGFVQRSALATSSAPWEANQRAPTTAASSSTESRYETTSAPESASHRSGPDLQQITERILRTIARQIEVERERRGGRQRTR